MRIWFAIALMSSILCAPGVGTLEREAAEQGALSPSEPIAEVRFIAQGLDHQPITDLQLNELQVSDHGRIRKTSELVGGPESKLVIGILFDASGSRRADQSAQLERQLARDLVHKVWRGNGYGFVAAFAGEVMIAARPTSDLNEIDKGFERLDGLTTYGPTALYDAICAVKPGAMAKVSGRKVMVVIGDFEDNTSRNKLETAMGCADAGGSQIFAVRIGDAITGERYGGEKRGHRIAASLAKQTGGRFFEPKKEELQSVFEEIRTSIEGSYRLRYTEDKELGKNTKEVLLSTSRSGVTISASHSSSINRIVDVPN